MKPTQVAVEVALAVLVASALFLFNAYNTENSISFDIVLPYDNMFVATTFTDSNSSITFSPTSWDCSKDNVVTFNIKQQAAKNPLLDDWSVKVDVYSSTIELSPAKFRTSSKITTSISFVSNNTGCKDVVSATGGCGNGCGCPNPNACWNQKKQCVWTDGTCKPVQDCPAGEVSVTVSIPISGSILKKDSNVISVTTLFNGITKTAALDVVRAGSSCDAEPVSPPAGSTVKPSKDDQKKPMKLSFITITIDIDFEFGDLSSDDGDNTIDITANIVVTITTVNVRKGSSFKPRGNPKSIQVNTLVITDGTFDLSNVSDSAPVNVTNLTFCGTNSSVIANNNTNVDSATFGCGENTGTATSTVSGGNYNSVSVNVDIDVQVKKSSKFKSFRSNGKKIKFIITETITITEVIGGGTTTFSLRESTTFTISRNGRITAKITFSLTISNKKMMLLATPASGSIGCGTTFGDTVTIDSGVVADFGFCTTSSTTAPSVSLLGTMQFSGIDGTLNPTFPLVVSGALTSSAGVTPTFTAACVSSWTSWGTVSQIKLATYGSSCLASYTTSVSNCPANSVISQVQEGANCVVYLKPTVAVSQSTATAAAVASPSPSPSPVVAFVSTSSSNSSEKGLYGLFALFALPVFLLICIGVIWSKHKSGQEESWGPVEPEEKPVPFYTPSNTPQHHAAYPVDEYGEYPVRGDGYPVYQ